MKARIVVAVVVGAFIGVLGTLGSTLRAQQTTPKFPSVLTRQGFSVEEVRVGASCVVVVSRGGPNDNVAAVPCGN